MASKKKTVSAAKFNVGDIVKLKSGGPDMVIERAHNPATETRLSYGGEDVEPEDVWSYRCTWFAGKAHKQATCRQEVLEAAGPKK